MSNQRFFILLQWLAYPCIFITADIPDERHASRFRRLSAAVEKPAGVQGRHGSVSIRGDGVANFDHCLNQNIMKVVKMVRLNDNASRAASKLAK